MKRMLLLVMCTALVIAVFVTPAAAATRSVSWYRGSSMLWTRDTATWSYTGTTVTSGSVLQQCGYIFPDFASKEGVRVTKYFNKWVFDSKYTIGIGVPTKWGPITAYARDYVHRISVYGSGAYGDYWI